MLYILFPKSNSCSFFLLSIITIGNTEINRVNIHCLEVKGTTSNIFAIGGKVTTTICKNIPNANAPIKYLFLKKPISKIELSSLLILKL